jgi:hypothetical protein
MQGEGECGVWCEHTDLIELHQEILRALLAQQRLGGFAVGAVGLGEDDDAILVDDLLGLGLCGGHGGGVYAGGEAEEAAEDLAEILSDARVWSGRVERKGGIVFMYCRVRWQEGSGRVSCDDRS